MTLVTLKKLFLVKSPFMEDITKKITEPPLWGLFLNFRSKYDGLSYTQNKQILL